MATKKRRQHRKKKSFRWVRRLGINISPQQRQEIWRVIQFFLLVALVITAVAVVMAKF